MNGLAVSDYDWIIPELNDKAIAAIMYEDITEEQRESIFCNNAKRLLGL